MSGQALTAITAQVHSTSVLLSHSTQVQLQPEVCFVGSVGTGEVSQERKGRGENLAGVGRDTSCPEQCLIRGSEEKVNVGCLLGDTLGSSPSTKKTRCCAKD